MCYNRCVTSVILGPIFARTLHPTDWKRPPGNLDYRVTNQFDGPDFLNGGIHRATDCGNTRMDEPLRAPANCRARGARHFDGALGVVMELGGGVTIALWHLNRYDVPATPVTVAKGARVGITGNSGAKLPNGQAMPAHTHVRAEREGVPFDIEPYLFGAPLQLTEDNDDVQIPAGLASLTAGVLAAGNRIRVDPSTTEGARVTEQDERVQVFGVVERPKSPWVIGDKQGATWYYIGLKREAGYVATALLPSVDLTQLGTAVVPAPNPDPALVARLDAARSASRGVTQALNAASSANDATRQALGG